MALSSRLVLGLFLWVAFTSPAAPGQEGAKQSSGVCDDGKVLKKLNLTKYP